MAEETEVSLPRATIEKLIKEYLPGDMRVGKETVEMLLNCCTEFVQLVGSQANEVATEDKKSTIQPEHVLRALQQLDLGQWTAAVQETMEAVKEEAKAQPKLGGRKSKAEADGLTDEELIAMQQRLFAEARAHSANLDQQAAAHVAAAYQQPAAPGAPPPSAGAAEPQQPPPQHQPPPQQQQGQGPGSFNMPPPPPKFNAAPPAQGGEGGA